MRKIPAAEAKVGDVIAAPVTDGQGRVLLPKGARLSAAVLSRLAGWGVRELAVEGDDPAAPGKSAAEMVDELEHRFADWQDDPLMMDLRDVVRRHLFRD
jgi:hypothetical protein